MFQKGTKVCEQVWKINKISGQVMKKGENARFKSGNPEREHLVCLVFLAKDKVLKEIITGVLISRFQQYCVWALLATT